MVWLCASVAAGSRDATAANADPCRNRRRDGSMTEFDTVRDPFVDFLISVSSAEE
jgi:hypothetical protein